MGCGALGCEYLKLLSILNASTKKGNLTITDMDNIELSNLNRQYLFETNDIGKSKSEIACKKIRLKNSQMKIQHYNLKVGEDSENDFTTRFWNKQDIIINALDNVMARQYIDRKCVMYDKPLFESGTLGLKCNNQIIIPKKTISYSETNDPPEKDVPVCTVKFYPSKIEHCIEWSLEIFNSLFNDNIRDSKYGDYLDVDKICIDSFKELFIHKIKKLLDLHPIDSKDKDGSVFWKGNKICPHLKTFEELNGDFNVFQKYFSFILRKAVNNNGILLDKDNINHIQFINCISNIRAKLYNIDQINSFECSLIMGKITPALCTSTSFITSVNIMEMLKMIHNESHLNIQKIDYLDGFFNLGLNLYIQSLPQKPSIYYSGMFSKEFGCKIMTEPDQFTIWDKIHLKGRKGFITVQNVLDYLTDLYDLDVSMISYQNQILYDDEESIQKNITFKDLYMENSISTQNTISLDILSYNENGIPTLIPQVIYSLYY